jgi:3-hydroxyisobutyrate dehydrogenase-like beta-hydroxyacid dehydrogenase
METTPKVKRIGIVGFGEAGSILGEDLAKAGSEVSTYDILLDQASTRARMEAKAGEVGVRTVNSLSEVIAGSDLIISAVTASSAAEVAAGAASSLQRGQVFLDINSVSPATKRANAQAVEASGADYVEAAVMAPVPPQRLAVPMLLGGRRASALAEALRALGMNTTAIAEDIGIASAVKMCRSIVIKGLEALTVECTLAARQFGAEQQVLASLHNTFPHMGWATHLPDYLVSRVAEHGRRRAAEMREVARTLADAGMQPTMASAIAQRQDWLVDAMAQKGIEYPHGQAFSWRALADALADRRGA